MRIPFPRFDRDDDGRSEQRRDVVPRGTRVEAVRGALREHGAAGPILLGVRSGGARVRSGPQGAADDAPRPLLRRFPLRGVAQCLPRRRFQHPGSISPSIPTSNLCSSLFSVEPQIGHDKVIMETN